MYYNSSTNETNMVYGNVRQAFNDFVFLAQDNFQKREKNMAESDKIAAKDSIEFVKELAKNPAAYFSRAATENAWNLRVKEYAKMHKIPEQEIGTVYLLAQGPKEIVLAKAGKAFYGNHSLFSMFYGFCKVVQDWEYFRTSDANDATFHKNNALNEIAIVTKRLATMVELQKTNPIIRPFKQMFQKEK